MRVPPTVNRVSLNTPQHINARIQRDAEASLAYFASHPDGIEDRLAELDREWDIERILEANAAALGLFGVTMGAVHSRRWLALPAAVTAFLLQHAIQGWCPPLPILRRLGFRSSREIEMERVALKAMRGDFEDGSGSDKPDWALDAARR